MARRRPLVASNGQPVELLPADTLPCNIAFTGTGMLPTLTLLLGNGLSNFTVSPKIAGDVLAAGECITVTPASALPAGLNISYAVVTANNAVQIAFSASIAITGASMAWTVVAHR